MATEGKKEPKVNWDKLDVPIDHVGRAITLPADPGKMPLRVALASLAKKIGEEEQPYDVFESFDAYPLDAAVACVKAMTELYGWPMFGTKVEQSFFGTRRTPPRMHSVKIGPKDEDVVQCPIGQFELPGVEDPIESVLHDEGFYLTGTIKKRDRHIVLELATVTRRILKEASIYKGKPIRLGVNSDGELELGTPPEFMDVRDVSESNLVFDPETQADIDTNILVPIKQTALCREHHIPLKRGVLLEGPFGTGKTLTARLTARVAEDNGWTFVLLNKVQGLRQALEFAKRYAPAVVFAEDVDFVISERNDAGNDLINQVDGVVSKNTEVMVILTTNHVEKIHPSMLRPGRLDAVISLRAPSAKTVERLLRYYAGDLLGARQNLTEAGKELEGQIPATIRECVERSKLGMIGRQAMTINQEDLVIAAKSMKNHMRLLAPKVPEATLGEKLAGALEEVVHKGASNGKGNGKDAELLTSIHTKVSKIERRV